MNIHRFGVGILLVVVTLLLRTTARIQRLQSGLECRTRALVCAVLVLVLSLGSLAGWLGGDAGAATARAAPDSQATGTLVICKTVPLGTLNPPSFSFTVQGLTTPVTVPPNSCTPFPSLTVPAGSVTITETPTAGFTVVGIEFVLGTGTTNVAAGSATATIVSGGVTLVRFLNDPTGLGGAPPPPSSGEHGQGNATAAHNCPHGPSAALAFLPRNGDTRVPTVVHFRNHGECVSFFAQHRGVLIILLL